MGTTALESSRTWLEGIDRHTYWIFPLYPLTEAAVFRLFGWGLLTMRAGSIFWGLLAVSAFYLLMRSQAERGIAALATLLVAIDFHFIIGASTGRMDMMCAALGYSALAAFLVLRQRSLRLAILISQTLAAAGLFTHPCGMLAVAGLVLLALQVDRSRLNWRLVAFGLVPYSIGLAVYAGYAMQDPQSFFRQLSGNVSGLAGEASGTTRFDGLLHPLSALWRELLYRYMSAFNGTSWRNPYRSQVLILLLYWGGAMVAILDRRVRQQKAARLLLSLCILYFVLMWLLEGLKLRVYLVHTIPLFAGLGALWIWNWTSGRPMARRAAVGLILLVQLLGLGVGFWRDEYRNQILPAAAFIKQHGQPGSSVIAPGQFVFEFGFDGRFVDDVRLGYLTGKVPDFYVRDSWYDNWLDQARTREPSVYQHVSNTLALRYREVFHNEGYRIYQLQH